MTDYRQPAVNSRRQQEFWEHELSCRVRLHDRHVYQTIAHFGHQSWRVQRNLGLVWTGAPPTTPLRAVRPVRQTVLFMALPGAW